MYVQRKTFIGIIYPILLVFVICGCAISDSNEFSYKPERPVVNWLEKEEVFREDLLSMIQIDILLDLDLDDKIWEEIVPEQTVECRNLSRFEAIDQKELRERIFSVHPELYLTLEDLYIIDANLESLEGIQICKNLRQLIVPSNNITDLSPIMGLERLEVLNVSNNRLDSKDLSDISGLKNLRSLRASGSNIANIEELSSLKELRILELSDNWIVDINPLTSLLKLHTLFLDSNYIVDVSALAQLQSLHWVDLSENPTCDISPIGKILPLKELHDFGPYLDLYDMGLSETDILQQLNIDGPIPDYISH